LIDIRERQLRASSSKGASDTQSDPACSSSYECSLPIDTIHLLTSLSQQKDSRHCPPFGFDLEPCLKSPSTAIEFSRSFSRSATSGSNAISSDEQMTNSLRWPIRDAGLNEFIACDLELEAKVTNGARPCDPDRDGLCVDRPAG
jgi:hypothetical protein